MNVLVLALLSAVQVDSARVCVVDARSATALTGMTVSAGSKPPQFLGTNCVRLPHGPVVIRRVGYRASTIELRGDTTVGLVPLGVARTQLDTQFTVASREITAQRGVSISTSDARERGAGSVAQMVSLLPFTQLQSARGEAQLSLRGARHEQVVVTLDGLPLNDPATGVADIAEFPLSAIGSATVVPGAAPLARGSGAIGGELALQSSTQPVFSARVGSWGQRVVEGALRLEAGRALWHFGAAAGDARNDFAFTNSVISANAPVEHRVNNDERRASLTGGMIAERLQLSASASTNERGMVGAVNVHTYDADRARTDRLTLRAGSQVAGVQLLASTRAIALSYRDPSRPVLDNHAHAVASQLELRGSASVFSWNAGGGGDAVRASSGIAQSRGRGFGAITTSATRSGIHLDGGIRLDAIGNAGLLPSFSVAARHPWSRSKGDSSLPGASGNVGVRFNQAVRVPTLYDLYFSSPQRLNVRALDPERVTHDVELSANTQFALNGARVFFEGALVDRRIRNAIVWFPGNFSWSPANVGVERMHGAEGRLGVELNNVSVAFWSSWYDSQLESGALHVPTPYVARSTGGAQAAFRAGASLFSIDSRATGRRPFTLGPRNRAYELPAVVLVDVAYSRRAHWNRVTLQSTASLDNIGNVQWQSVSGYPAPGRSWALAFTVIPDKAQ